MKTLVIYDSVFGNTELIARVIAESLGSKKGESPRDTIRLQAASI